jgi:hypothetical protein
MVTRGSAVSCSIFETACSVWKPVGVLFCEKPFCELPPLWHFANLCSVVVLAALQFYQALVVGFWNRRLAGHDPDIVTFSPPDDRLSGMWRPSRNAGIVGDNSERNRSEVAMTSSNGSGQADRSDGACRER